MEVYMFRNLKFTLVS